MFLVNMAAHLLWCLVSSTQHVFRVHPSGNCVSASCFLAMWHPTCGWARPVYTLLMAWLGAGRLWEWPVHSRPQAMTLMEYLIKTGSERVSQQCKENMYAVQTLKDFQYVDRDGKDQGVNVREKAKQLVALLRDEDRLREERAHALKTKEKLAQTATGEAPGRPGAGPSALSRGPPVPTPPWPQPQGCGFRPSPTPSSPMPWPRPGFWSPVLVRRLTCALPFP